MLLLPPQLHCWQSSSCWGAPRRSGPGIQSLSWAHPNSPTEWPRKATAPFCSHQDHTQLSAAIPAMTKFPSTGKLPEALVKLDIFHSTETENLTTCSIYIIVYMFKASFRHYLQLRRLVSQAGSLFSISSHGISENGFFTCARNTIKHIWLEVAQSISFHRNRQSWKTNTTLS